MILRAEKNILPLFLPPALLGSLLLSASLRSGFFLADPIKDLAQPRIKRFFIKGFWMIGCFLHKRFDLFAPDLQDTGTALCGHTQRTRKSAVHSFVDFIENINRRRNFPFTGSFLFADLAAGALPSIRAFPVAAFCPCVLGQKQHSAVLAFPGSFVLAAQLHEIRHGNCRQIVRNKVTAAGDIRMPSGRGFFLRQRQSPQHMQPQLFV
ncbi:MAG: hypothetical protein DBX91_01970 [Subdoligranulum variabile]|nr:MAG: hypothetical protein DBX91_01970 [Subdoligranulum variabile]